MKTQNIILAFIAVVLFVSCDNAKEANATKVELQSIEVTLDGMTCEIGCAKLIQSKVYKLEGVTESKVEFEKNIGVFTFDKNKISSKEIIKNIEGIAGGDLYKVTASKSVD